MHWVWFSFPKYFRSGPKKRQGPNNLNKETEAQDKVVSLRITHNMLVHLQRTTATNL